MEAYCYAVALKVRVSLGDLYGGIKDMTEDEMIDSLSETMLCARTVPIDDSDLSLGFQCPMNAPANASLMVKAFVIKTRPNANSITITNVLNA